MILFTYKHTKLSDVVWFKIVWTWQWTVEDNNHLNVSTEYTEIIEQEPDKAS